MTLTARRARRSEISAHAVANGTAATEEVFGVSDQTVRNACRENGVSPKRTRRPKNSPEQRKAIAGYASERGTEETMARFGCGKLMVWRCCRECGCKPARKRRTSYRRAA